MLILLILLIELGVLDPTEQSILANWHNSLIDGYTKEPITFWNVGSTLCGQKGVTCDSSTPYQRVIKLYFFFFFFTLLFHFFFWNIIIYNV